MGFELLNQTNFPVSIPFLDAFFTPDRIFNILELFEVDQMVNSVFLGEAFNGVGFVLKNTTNKVVCYTHVQRAAEFARKDVNKIPLSASHNAIVAIAGLPGQAVRSGDVSDDGLSARHSPRMRGIQYFRSSLIKTGVDYWIARFRGR